MKWKRKKKKKKKQVKAQKKPLVDKAQRTNLELLCVGRKEEDVKEKGRKRSKSLRAKQVLGRSGRWLFLLLILVQDWVCIDAAAGRREPKGKAEVPENHYRVGCGVDLDGKSLQEEQMEKHQREWKRFTGVDRTEMRKEEKRLRCALLNGSAWSTEKKYMIRYWGTFDIFFGMEHRMRKEEMGGTVQQRGPGRKEVCSDCSKNY